MSPRLPRAAIAGSPNTAGRGPTLTDGFGHLVPRLLHLAWRWALIGISTSGAARGVDSPLDPGTIAQPCRDRRRKR
jgi:hypothetical protein